MDSKATLLNMIRRRLEKKENTQKIFQDLTSKGYEPIIVSELITEAIAKIRKEPKKKVVVKKKKKTKATVHVPPKQSFWQKLKSKF